MAVAANRRGSSRGIISGECASTCFLEPDIQPLSSRRIRWRIALLNKHAVFVVGAAKILDRDVKGAGPPWRPSRHTAGILAGVLIHEVAVFIEDPEVKYSVAIALDDHRRLFTGWKTIGLKRSVLNASTSVVVLLGPSTGTATSAAAPVSKDPADESVSRIRLNISVSPRFGFVLRSSFRRSHPSKRKGRANGAMADKREDPKGHRQSEVWRDMLAPAFHANMFGASQTKRKGGEDARACE